MHLAILLPVLAAAAVHGQGKGLGCPPPAPILLSTTKSGVLPVLPTPFSGVETLEGAIMEKGPPNPDYTPVNGPAPTQSNPAGATYRADLPSTNFDDCTGSTVTGSITVSSSSDGNGAAISVNFEGLPDVATYGPFVYHIHDLPVPADGDCTATLGHLDPQNGGEYYPCIPSTPENCQVGDLAGKYGSISTSSFSLDVTDPFLSTAAGNPASVAGRSIVIHSSNTTRLTCANFQMVSGGSNMTMPNATVPASPSASSVVPATGVGAVAGYSFAAVVAGVAAFFL
ncbi:Cell surface superoxide dismutase [Cu-Zn] 4 [Saxophila tyrrhenica]|uniref:superoxide dismutase n=1 Tax=Saxophila tyrrhenica TaxID=1690608 RepID=A0AAV9NUK7_9PEZI|nr:Cell surface superoxide dismutase [Cu-Zn] 4 [Saxophila tyrrhenica]